MHDALARLQALHDSLLAVKDALTAPEDEALLLALARYDEAAAAQLSVDWSGSPQRQQAVALMTASQSMLEELLPLVRRARDESQAALQNVHNADKLNRAYR
ncbi:hypothetical protein ACFQIB_01460 [Jeongeupia naejangsanensis]|uniref:Flagellar protein FliT n=1 Tax=Jeongeupia naejangsanensis TaxID=613195 RepID=A0ABS2BF29_9NEIS|nr:hypothetical protein [Jeongeupia naejangsanensis]MBM3114210.1 hypothetical protein [Jeongeupia naejangsanensis]